MRDAIELEKRGKPTITVTHDKFERAAHAHAKSLGMPDLPLLVEPAPKGGNLTTEAPQVAQANLDLVIQSLTSTGSPGGQ